MQGSQDLNGGKPSFSEKGNWYNKRRSRPSKEGARTYQSGDKERQEKGHERIFGKYECVVCKTEVPKGRFTCTSCQEM
jgi:hypothetical protein